MEKTTMNDRVVKAVENAVFKAIEIHGVNGLKKTSLFMSNERTVSAVKLAA